MSLTALIVAAGKGERLGGGLPKQFRTLAGKPLLRRAVEPLLRHPRVDRLHIVVGPDQEDLARRALEGLGLSEPLIGGATRQQSVRNGLQAVETDHVLVHDAARPFCPGAVIDRLVAALSDHDGAVPVLPVADTLARAGDILGEPIERGGAVRVQTPQAFATDLLRRAHDAWNGDSATDDASVARAIGAQIAVVSGDTRLEKLTTEEDWHRAEAALCALLVSRTGMGFDVHAFDGEGPIMLGGISIDHPRGLAGHSDADVVLHAITDALLGAACLGDIGAHFPPNDPQWKGASSDLFLRHAAGLIRERAGLIDHVDCTIIAEEPKVGPHRSAIRQQVAEILDVQVDKVSIKATTTERLGFTGRGEGMAAQAVATIRVPADA